MTPARKTITALTEVLQSLSAEDAARFRTLYHVSESIGTLDPPEEMHEWIRGFFGSLEAVQKQRITKITNLWTLEGSLFNDVRANRPMEAKASGDLEDEIQTRLKGPFGAPLKGTPSDSFGRVQGKHSITASNIAKYDGYHGVVIFDDAHPLQFTAESVADAIDTALAWGHRAHEADAEARYFFFMWNCLWKAGASIIHGHAQMTMTRHMHYARVEHWRRAAIAYRASHGRNYFEDLAQTHRSLGLTLDWDDTRVLAYLTPIKEKEILLIAEELNDGLKQALYRALQHLVDALGVRSFNVALYAPPIAPAPEDWSDFPTIIRIVDRGDPLNRTADMGAMELYASSVVSSDPFRLIESLADA